MTYGQMGASDDPARADRVVLGQVATRQGFRVMAFAVWPQQPSDQGTNGFYLYLQVDDAAELTRVWEALGEGAEVRQPLGPSAWSPLAGQLRDRFGVVWALDTLQIEGLREEGAGPPAGTLGRWGWAEPTGGRDRLGAVDPD